MIKKITINYELINSILLLAIFAFLPLIIINQFTTENLVLGISSVWYLIIVPLLVVHYTFYYRLDNFTTNPISKFHLLIKILLIPIILLLIPYFSILAIKSNYLIFQIILILFLLPLITLTYFISTEKLKSKVVLFLYKYLTFGMNKKTKKDFDIHGVWRYKVIDLKWNRFNRNFNFLNFIHSFRWLWILAVSFLSITALWYFIGEQLYTAILNKNNIDKVIASNGIWSFLIFCITAPVAFIVWIYRDQNNRQTIENSRKDINLKDFQKISEIASGMHLLDNKTTIATKKINKDHSDIEITESNEVYNHFDESEKITKQKGMLSMQIASVYQLGEFCKGTYGQEFQLSAFQLLISLWQSIIPKDILRRKEYFYGDTQTSLAKAISFALTKNYGDIFHYHHEHLKNNNFSGIPLHNLNLEDLNFQGTHFVDTLFLNGNLQKITFSHAQFIGGNFAGTNLQEADFSWSSIKEMSFASAKLQGASFKYANLIDVKFTHHTNLTKTNFENSTLKNIDFSGADITDIIINEYTQFIECKYDDSTISFAQLPENIKYRFIHTDIIEN